jgi:hypothetical protein
MLDFRLYFDIRQTKKCKVLQKTRTIVLQSLTDISIITIFETHVAVSGMLVEILNNE